MPSDVQRVLIAVSLDGARFADVEDLSITVSPASSTNEYAFVPAASVETALVGIEIYRRDDRWQLRAVGQGYDDGLAGLARDFGVNVARRRTPTPEIGAWRKSRLRKLDKCPTIAPPREPQQADYSRPAALGSILLDD